MEEYGEEELSEDSEEAQEKEESELDAIIDDLQEKSKV